MSFQRIFEMVKRQGMPLVITDGQGKDPLIVLPLDMYEALADGQALGAPPSTQEGEKEPVIIPVKEKPSPAESDLLADLSIEERFYIESLEEDKNS
ncbi:hypothetical protein EDM68_03850 [Candidatus Uhrbacteria bacterium]|nr:MAG: hypothetical protein EDM68_03850 [Candidatus Uhrbacteria bacterium]